ncbi:MAG: putative baseplate assembly protein [Solirubrobacteraceae bacterium]|nr:putative baseplate assembly protein [Solirubrobacteraceae bacterium]
MTLLPTIDLDDRTFQDLVSEARTRIAQACPEWTEHNVSDPGITLVELFAWMTELTIYRLNRIPDKLHVALLELLGIRLDPPSAASVDLRFRLTGPAAEPVRMPLGETEVGTPRTVGDEPVVFQTTEDFTIVPLRPVAYVLSRDGQVKSVSVADGVAKPHGDEQLAFGAPPQPGDALQLGFDAPIGRLLVSVDVEASQARGAGVDPTDPPLRWEVSAGDNRWHAAEVLDDLTGGFNYGSGAVHLQLPPRSAVQLLGGQRLHWLRCRVDELTGAGVAGATYTHAPEIYSITAAPIGALLPAAHSARAGGELLGVSDGTPGQTFELRASPVLPLAQDETLEVQRPGERAWTAWELRESFASSTAADPHFSIDLVAGRVELGPAIREPNGSWVQYGKVPPKGSLLRLTGYRHGGGRRGNVAAGTLTMLKSSLAGIDTVVNPRAALGGVDAESLTAARQRAAMEIRSRYRAVTAEDYEFLAGEASPRVARARCLPPQDGGAVALYLLPRVHPADRRLSGEELVPDEALLRTVAEYLDERRTIGTTVQLLPVRLRGVSVVVHLQTSPTADVRRVEEDVTHALDTYVNPLVGGSAHGPGSGWPFGRPLNQGELYGIVHAIEGVEFVKILRVYETNIQTGEQQAKPAGSHVELEPDELLASGQHIVKATRREL